MNSPAIRPLPLALACALAAAPGLADESGPETLRAPDLAPALEAPPPAPAETGETREARLDRLFRELSEADADAAKGIAEEIHGVWSRSGSDSMDLLLERGLGALRIGDFERARAHLGALTRLAPDFAEGWNASATLAYHQEDLGRS
ncbi:MAG: hypothetical protein ACK5MQ_12475, partial [Pikeienuella sp.]